MIDDLGFCHDCHSHIYEHPNVRCPNCGQGKPSPKVKGATDPVGQLLDIRTSIRTLALDRTKLTRDRRALARHILNTPDLLTEARKRGVRLSSLDKWASPPALKSCVRGHLTAEWGDWDGRRWSCRKCAEEGPKKVAPAAVRKDTSIIAAAWRKHDAMIAERERLAALDQIPARLKPPMPPPVR